MTRHYDYDVIVVGSGPNGLAAAITMARAGCSVLVLEAADVPGGGMRSAALTLPGYVHDVCSTVEALALGSPFFQSVPLTDYGVTWAYADAPLAHPLDGGTAVVLERSVAATADGLDGDGKSYIRLLQPLVDNWPALADSVLSPLLRIPPHPLFMSRFALPALLPAPALFATYGFKGERARALLGGLCAHAMLPVDGFGVAGFGLALAAAGHRVGWPVARGGTQHLADAMVAYLNYLGGQVICGQRVDSLAQLPPARAVLCDLTPRELLRVAGDVLPPRYRRALGRYRFGLGIFKLDWALSGPIPWRAPECRRAASFHLGGTYEEVVASERAAWEGRHAERPYVILVHQTAIDPTRAPEGKHTAWGYCHVPSGSTVDMTEAIEMQVERFAPGFRDLVLARSAKSSAWYESYNPNYVGGDINGGVQDLRQLFGRPLLRLDPYATPVRGLYMCSSATPPGGGVHGMCGYYAAASALRKL